MITPPAITGGAPSGINTLAPPLPPTPAPLPTLPAYGIGMPTGYKEAIPYNAPPPTPAPMAAALPPPPVYNSDIGVISSASQINLAQANAPPAYPSVMGNNAMNLLGMGVASLVPFKGGLQLRLNSTGMTPSGDPNAYIYANNVTT